MRPPQDRTAVDRGKASPPYERRLRLGAALGAGAAALVSAGLVYWIGSTQDRSISASQPKGASATKTASYAPSKPDPEQVVRAYEQLQEIYAEQGVQGVIDFARSCAASLRSDPGVLDFCLAFDIYAAPLEEDPGARGWRAGVAARDLALAQNALPPGADAAARLGQVRALARQTSLEAPGASEPTESAPAGAPSQAKTAAQPVHVAHSKPRKGMTACRLRATAAQRMVCASPALREADRRLRLAYRHALAAGVGPRRLARDQARFRTAVNAAGADRTKVARLYHRRLRALEAQIRRVQHSVD